MPRLSLSGQIAALVRRDGPGETRVDLRGSWGFARGQNLTVGAFTAFPEGLPAVFGLSATVTFPFSRNPAGATGQMFAGAASDGTGSAGIAVGKSMPQGPGYGYRAQASASVRSGSGTALVEGQTDFARAEAAFDSYDGSSVGSFAVAGGVVVLRERVFLTRPVEQGFALVQVPGVEGVTTFRENQPIGRTDSNGDVLIPDVGPFRANRISISDADVPIDRTLTTKERLVVGPRRAGAVAVFPAERLQAITGRLTVYGSTGVSVPAGGTLRVGVEGKVSSSPIGDGGEFWIEDLPPGSHPAEIFWRGTLCRFAISVPEGGAGVADLGELGCGTQPRAHESR
jgi:outer membrane usher protein